MNIQWTLPALAVLIVCVACKKDDPEDDTAEGVGNLMEDGTWRITEFVEDGDNETNHFTGFNFTFGKDNVVTATNGSSTYSGTWHIEDSNSKDDDLDDLDFVLSFPAPPDFAELSDDWDIMDKTLTMIRLIDVSGGGGGTDYLRFEKN